MSEIVPIHHSWSAKKTEWCIAYRWSFSESVSQENLLDSMRELPNKVFRADFMKPHLSVTTRQQESKQRKERKWNENKYASTRIMAMVFTAQWPKNSSSGCLCCRESRLETIKEDNQPRRRQHESADTHSSAEATKTEYPLTIANLCIYDGTKSKPLLWKAPEKSCCISGRLETMFADHSGRLVATEVLIMKFQRSQRSNFKNSLTNLSIPWNQQCCWFDMILSWSSLSLW